MRRWEFGPPAPPVREWSQFCYIIPPKLLSRQISLCLAWQTCRLNGLFRLFALSREDQRDFLQL